MSYIGNNLQVAYPSYRVIDDISSGFNGVLTTFALRVAGSTPIPFPINPQQCLLSVNNIVQKPDSTGASGFTLTGSNIVFATAPASGWSFFGTVLAGADYVNVGANFPSGTAAVPSVTFDQSTGTGLFLASSNVLGITTGGVQRLVVNSSGNVGIGTSSPSYDLHVTGSGTSGTLCLSPSGTGGNPSYIILGNSDSSGAPGPNVISSANRTLSFGVGTSFTAGGGGTFTEYARIDSSGRVGIGTTSPVALLQVGAGNTSASTAKVIINTNNVSGGGLLVSNWTGGATTNGPRIIFDNSGQGGFDIGGGNGNNTFVIRDNAASSDRLTIDSSGRVGIGTTSPGYKLDVTGGNVGINTSAGTAASVVFNQNGIGVAEVGMPASENALTFKTWTGAALLERARIDSSGRMGIGTQSPSEKLNVIGNIQVGDSGNERGIYVGAAGSSGAFLYQPSGDVQLSPRSGYGIKFAPAPGSATEWGRWDSSGRLLVGTSTSSAVAKVVVQGITSDPNALGVIQLQVGTTTPADATRLGRIDFADSAGGTGVWIQAARDGGTWTSGSSHPTRLVFFTTADGAVSPTERMRIENDGNVAIGKAGQTISYQNPGISLFSSGSADFTRASAYLISVNRRTDDGVLVEFYQENSLEGTISVSGTTVSYNGAHLSRWSQLPSGAERTEILRGTLLSNIDEMCEWSNEDNEQLNRMKVSDVEGDKNVSGVFQAWDDDDDTYTNDFYCAMTGDFIIRIAEGVTVERGDLLMSAGDGTAKPQDDDIIRSKTIAKVTSTNVSCTYDDGSYCVPCVLMAC